ncbi:cytochrome P450 family protein [Mycobacterium xenopi 4042]|uniref:Cytochrome P450 family protein n=1 Tax=Mycobacterium xenopi 4042 TaxID=1299334 RepID=X8AEP3_MYCXE|nr:cytochrome P450 family protein [Mycobacterium xenopi 4042]
MRSLLNKVFTPRAIQSQRQMVTEKIDKYLGAVDPDRFDVVQDFSGPFPVEVITTMLGVPEEHAQQIRHWIDESLTREPGRSKSGSRVCRPISTPRCCTTIW